ncbi:MAG: hypothetical protein ACLR06_05640 [Christensenellaceae bacterium]
MKISIIEELLNGELQTRWEATDKSPKPTKFTPNIANTAIKSTLCFPRAQQTVGRLLLAEGGVCYVERKSAFRIGARFGLFLALELLEEEMEPVS